MASLTYVCFVSYSMFKLPPSKKRGIVSLGQWCVEVPKRMFSETTFPISIFILQH